jgi:TolB-like protein/tetratricopeptide (TPR) repeat protein
MSAQARAGSPRFSLRTRATARAAVAYAAVAWGLLQVLDVVDAPLGLPAWSMRAAIVTTVAAFPLALAAYWLVALRRVGDAVPHAAAGSGLVARGPKRIWISATVIAILLCALAVLLVRALHLGAPAPPLNPAVAVLPFRDTGSAPGRSDFADGLVEDIVDRLGSVPGLRVVAANSSFKMRDAEPRDVAARLGVTTVLQGTVRRTAERLRLTARLVDAATGYVVWSGSFDREPRDVFRMQAELATAIVAAIVPTARGDAVPVPDAAVPTPTELSAYDLYLIGRQGEWQRTPDSIHRALTALERSIELNPDYAPAQAQLALTLVNAIGYANIDRQPALQRAQAAARRALALDSHLAAAHVALAISTVDVTGAHDDATLAMLERALELNPNDALAAYQYSRSLWHMGHDKEGLRWLEKSLAIDPLAITPRCNLIAYFHDVGDVRRRTAEEATYERLFAGDVDGLTILARLRVRVTQDPVGAVRAALAARRLAPAVPTPDAVLYLHRALLAVGAIDAARQLRETTDWRTTAPATWLNERALEAAAASDPAKLDEVIGEMRTQAGDPERDAALMVWLGARGRHAEAVRLRSSADNSGPLRLYRAAGLERDFAMIAGLCSQARVGPAGLVQKEAGEFRAELAKDFREGANSTIWLMSAMFKLCLAGDTAAISDLQKAFELDAIPWSFAVLQLWFEPLYGHAAYDRLVAHWSDARERAKGEALHELADTAAPAPR